MEYHSAIGSTSEVDRWFTVFGDIPSACNLEGELLVFEQRFGSVNLLLPEQSELDVGTYRRIC